MSNAVSLYELTTSIRLAIARALPQTYWVRAEISEGRRNINGHFYCKFIEKNAAGQDIASANGIIWAGTYNIIKARFERETGQALAAGIKVLVNVKVNFHERYGLSLVVNDIDPSYTLGDMVRRRKEILAQLAKDGVANMNKEIVLPRPLMRIAIITSETAAGYGDFMNHIKSNGYGFQFNIKLFPATMQGDKVETSVITALNCIAAEAANWDAVAIIRGGGAVSDLNGFESYALASNIAQFVLPVITGIGHERDETVIDLVANTGCKTPTAVADFWFRAPWERRKRSPRCPFAFSGRPHRLWQTKTSVLHTPHRALRRRSRMRAKLQGSVSTAFCFAFRAQSKKFVPARIHACKDLP